MSSGNGIRTYTGLWTNWTHGAILGATLTLPQRYGGLLAAFLAVYVSFAGGMFWRFLNFVLHQMNTTKPGDGRDGLHHQRQVILRNSDGAPGALLGFVRMPISWRGKTRRPFLRVFGYALIAALNIAVFGVASIFTSTVTKVAGNSTIILGPSCGGYSINPSSDGRKGDFRSKVLADTYQAATYVRQCYGENATGPACGMYYRRNLGFTTHPNATCPVASNLCDPNDRSAFSMDTGLVDSHLDLGVMPGRNTEFNIDALPRPASPSNHTFSYYSCIDSNNFGYILSAVYALASAKNPWEPDALLNRTDADVILMMLNQNAIRYKTPSDDPWMPAHYRAGSVWIRDYPLTLMACTDQYQICNPNKGQSPSACTKLLGQEQVLTALGNGAADINDYQAQTAARILASAITMSMYYAVQGRGGSALNANEHAFQNSQAYIPPTQWQTEVSIWFSTCLAKLQSYMVEWATEPSNVELGPGSPVVVNTPTDHTEAAMCRNQMVHGISGEQSFSVLGLALILTFGGVLIVLGAVIDTIVSWLQTGRKAKYRHTQWILEEKLQLQRAAYEGLGVGGIWEGKLDAVPATAGISVLIPPSSDVFLMETAKTQEQAAKEEATAAESSMRTLRSTPSGTLRTELAQGRGILDEA